ncbi:flavin-containing monooxygenase [Paraglaciecola marina]|uniref:flavin-containing monooxygenase n=1 Tax=Paraglaciecola marina TaxID=2500157 RepID=UPI00105EE334|nr:NAD(P)-binding domain-containing protein [Paraglaciecola marina]
MKKKIGVIGAGLSGLVTIKELIEEGHDVICLEKNKDIGGVFSKMGSYDSVELTVSNYFMAYSDFMPYDEPVKFWTRKEYKQYLDKYAKHFDLLKYIKFDCDVTQIEDTSENFIISGVGSDNQKFSETVDTLAVCSGQFQKPNIPDIEGLDTFLGDTMHSAEYTNVENCNHLKGKKVLFLGAGESGADVVTEIAGIASHSVLALRRRHLFSQKNVGGSNTIDMVQTRFWHSIPANEKAEAVRTIWRNIRKSTDNKALSLLADHVILAPDEPGSVVTKTERIFEAEANGMVIDIGGITRVNGSQVEFESGRSESFDAIVFCTGFKFSLPFMKNDSEISDIRDCYLQSFHKDLKERVAFIGFARPQQGGVPLIAELQARYFARVISDKIQLPENLYELAIADKKLWQEEFYETPHVFGLVNGQRFNEKIADLIGCRLPAPNIIFSPKSFVVYWLHHIWPCQFRVVGPGKQNIAKEKWTNAPSIYSKKAKLKLIIGLSIKWLMSRNAKNTKERWRSILVTDRN